MVPDIRTRNLYTICCGVFLAAIAFMTWVDYRGTTLTGLDTQVGPALLVVGAGLVLLGLHGGFGEGKAAVVALAGVAVALLAVSFGQRLGWTGTTFWPVVATALGGLVAVIGLSGLVLPERAAAALERPDAE